MYVVCARQCKFEHFVIGIIWLFTLWFSNISLLAMNSRILLTASLVVTGMLLATPAFASAIDGTINQTNHYTWSDTFGWIDFRATGGDVHVTDTGLTGYAWNEKTGWISLNCTNGSNTCTTINFGVANDGNGHLSGKAWSQTVGYIDFAPTGGGVTIDSSGNFSGYAWGDKVGWISFNCGNGGGSCTIPYNVSTDWVPQSARSSSSSSSESSSSSSSAKIVNGGGGGNRGTTGGTNHTTLGTPGKPSVKGNIQNLTSSSRSSSTMSSKPLQITPAERALLRKQKRATVSSSSVQHSSVGRKS